MNLNLSWDLFILVFFGVVTAYSFIIGRNQALKVISATYIAILCSDAFGNIFEKYFSSSMSFLKMIRYFSFGGPEQVISFIKILCLIILIVIIAVRGMYNFDVEDDRPLTVRLATILILGVLSAGLMISTMLIFVSGGSLVLGNGMNVETGLRGNILENVYDQSRLVKIIIDYADFWFITPGVALIFLSLASSKE